MPTLPFLKTRPIITERYVSVRSPRQSTAIRIRDAATHGAMLAEQIDRIWKAMAARPSDERDPAAINEIIAIQPATGDDVPADQFDSSRYGLRLISKDPDTGIVLVDAQYQDLRSLRRKLDAYSDDALVNQQTGERRNARALNPVDQFRIAQPEDLMGLALQNAIRNDEISASTPVWMELGCRGGRRATTVETERSRQQVNRVLERLGRTPPIEFLAAEQAIFFARLSIADLRNLVRTTDCVFEVDLASRASRDWLLFEHTALPTPEFMKFALTPPPADAVAIAILDTGVASAHPLLASAMLSRHTVVPNDSSSEDLHGHGTLMAGVALHEDVGSVVERNAALARHWIESVKILIAPHTDTALDDLRTVWPVLTQRAIESAESNGLRRRVFAMAVTAALPENARATSWSHAVDQFAYNDGAGRLICVSAGNCDEGLSSGYVARYPRANLLHTIEDPAHAANAITVGAFTEKTELSAEYRDTAVYPLAPPGGISPFTRAGFENYPIKPDVVFEGGNLMVDGAAAFNSEATLSVLSTGRDVLKKPLGLTNATSAATAIAARFAADVWGVHSHLRPETIRGLIVHSARWTSQMTRQFADLDERLRLCGYGVPDLSCATECLASRATIILEDEMPNAERVMDDDGEERRRRVIRFIRIPIPEDLLLADPDDEVELRVTLSFFAEPSTFRKTESFGLRLAWDMQGPVETVDQFRARINAAVRPSGDEKDTYEKTSGFDRTHWEIGKERRSRGTVQSDRMRVPASLLAGEKLIAVYPVLGWWEDRNSTREERMSYSLLTTLEVPGKDIYTPIALALESSIEIES